MRTVGLGIQEFEKIRDGNLFYVDKTSFIARWYRKHDDITLITRPRRFGKTLTMDMLDCFFSMSYAGRKDLFEGLAISRDQAMMEMHLFRQLTGTAVMMRRCLSCRNFLRRPSRKMRTQSGLSSSQLDMSGRRLTRRAVLPQRQRCAYKCEV